MKQAVEAYRSVTATEEFREAERMRRKARVDWAYALHHAEQRANEKWQRVVAEKDVFIAEKDAFIAELQAQLRNYENRN